MKKLFLMMIAVIASFNMYAETVNEEVTAETSVVSSYNLLAIHDIVLSEITYPYVITEDIQTSGIVSVSGPSQPNVIGWTFVNGVLTIPLQARDLMDLDPGMTAYIEIHTEAGECYLIQLNCK